MDKDFRKFFENFKKSTETQWKIIVLDKGNSSYQIQPGTRWLDGHTADEVNQILNMLKLQREEVHQDFIDLLLLTKGLSLPHVTFHPQPEENKYKQSWRLNIEYIKSGWQKQLDELHKHKELYELSKIVSGNFTIAPIYAHRLIVQQNQDLKVYSIYGEDIIVYGDTLQEYLEREFLKVVN